MARNKTRTSRQEKAPLSDDTYKPCDCGAHCLIGIQNLAKGITTEPCWGLVLAVDEVGPADDFGYIHVCEGHHHGPWYDAKYVARVTERMPNG